MQPKGAENDARHTFAHSVLEIPILGRQPDLAILGLVHALPNAHATPGHADAEASLLVDGEQAQLLQLVPNRFRPWNDEAATVAYWRRATLHCFPEDHRSNDQVLLSRCASPNEAAVKLVASDFANGDDVVG